MIILYYTEIITKNPCYTAGQKIVPSGLMLHSVGCPQPSAKVFIKNFNNPNYQAAVHAFIDANTGDIYQTLPWNWRAWHCGGQANNTHIGVEMCESDCIKYTNGSTFTCSDRNRAMQQVETAYNSAVNLFADLCKQYNLNPLQDGVIISHAEGSKRGIASGHGDPDHLWKQLETAYTMNGFRQDVYNKMKGEEEEVTQEQFNQMMNVWLEERAKQQPDTWSAADRDWAEKTGLIKGDETGNKRYKSFITREEIAALFHRFK